MSVVVLIAGRDPLTGMNGMVSYVRTHARAASLAGYRPHIFCPEDPPGVVQTDLGVVHRIGLDRWRVPLEARSGGSRTSLLFLDAPRLGVAVARFLRARPDARVVHGFGAWGCAASLARRHLRGAARPVATVTSMYTTAADESGGRVRGAGALPARLLYRFERLWHRWLVTPLERRAYREAQLVLVNYESMRRLLLQTYAPGPEIRKLPYAPETAFRTAEPGAPPPPLAALTPAGAPLIVSVSRHDPRKGLDVLLRALAVLKVAGVPFRACITSGGALLAEHRRLATRLGLDGTAVLTGWVADPRPFLQHADVFVLPSHGESSGSMALLEAMQAGLAIVASGVDGIPEDVTDGASALLVAPGRVGELARALASLLEDADRRRRLGAQARAAFLSRFSAGAFSGALGALYAELGGRPRPSAQAR